MPWKLFSGEQIAEKDNFPASQSLIKPRKVASVALKVAWNIFLFWGPFPWSFPPLGETEKAVKRKAIPDEAIRSSKFFCRHPAVAFQFWPCQTLPFWGFSFSNEPCLFLPVALATINNHIIGWKQSFRAISSPPKPGLQKKSLGEAKKARQRSWCEFGGLQRSFEAPKTEKITNLEESIEWRERGGGRHKAQSFGASRHSGRENKPLGTSGPAKHSVRHFFSPMGKKFQSLKIGKICSERGPVEELAFL